MKRRNLLRAVAGAAGWALLTPFEIGRAVLAATTPGSGSVGLTPEQLNDFVTFTLKQVSRGKPFSRYLAEMEAADMKEKDHEKT